MRDKKEGDLTAVLLAADLVKLKKESRWRPYPNYCARLTAAWFFNYAIFYTCLLMALAYGVKFGNKESKVMVISWFIAICQNYCVVEPLQIALNAGAPCLFDDSHALGRCCLWVRFIYNELFSP